MSTYVMSDLHGEYDLYIKMLEKISFSEADTLYILGDILDRGSGPIRIMLDVMQRHNVHVLAGNHCVMALECLKFLMHEITEVQIEKIEEEMYEKLLCWVQNGGGSTILEFSKLNALQRTEIIDYIENLELYAEVTVNDKNFILVHAGLRNFSEDKPMWEYELDELVWTRPDYEIPYYNEKFVVSGHTPTAVIIGNPKPGYIFKMNNHIAIDCGACFKRGRLGCLRLEDMVEYYVENQEKNQGV